MISTDGLPLKACGDLHLLRRSGGGWLACIASVYRRSLKGPDFRNVDTGSTVLQLCKSEQQENVPIPTAFSGRDFLEK